MFINDTHTNTTQKYMIITLIKNTRYPNAEYRHMLHSYKRYIKTFDRHTHKHDTITGLSPAIRTDVRNIYKRKPHSLKYIIYTYTLMQDKHSSYRYHIYLNHWYTRT